MAEHSGSHQALRLRAAADRRGKRRGDGPATYRVRGLHRIPSPPPALRGRIVIAAVAVGAAAAAAAGHAAHPAGAVAAGAGGLGDHRDATAAMGVGGSTPASPDVLLMARTTNPSVEVAKLAESQHAFAERAAAIAEANRPKFVIPAQGRFTSGFAPRWGSFHYGIDIANVKDTPIVAAADGVIIEAGPAHGFGLWVREELSDGTILVYGHMDDFSVHAGEHVKAGEEIARMGERGEATGYHLHFEVWNPSGKKINPVPWLNAHGVNV
ncbi:MAG: M23 family metallopeptidase [Sciscionella sp.]